MCHSVWKKFHAIRCHLCHTQIFRSVILAMFFSASRSNVFTQLFAIINYFKDPMIFVKEKWFTKFAFAIDINYIEISNRAKWLFRFSALHSVYMSIFDVNAKIFFSASTSYSFQRNVHPTPFNTRKIFHSIRRLNFQAYNYNFTTILTFIHCLINFFVS